MTRRSLRRALVVVGSTTLVAGVLLLVLGSSGGAVPAPPAAESQHLLAADASGSADADVAAGEQLYLTGCVSCHGVEGAGTDQGPPLTTSGAAYADFMLRTGRMPLAAPAPQSPQKPPAYDDRQIEQLVAYVASLGNGPPIPDVQPDRGDLAEGSQLYLANCAACHNASGIGGALSYGNEAPSLLSVAPTQIGEAVRVGPGQMPVFGPETLTSEQVDSIARYVGYLQEPEHPGGLRLGGAGPVPEGFIAWLVGLGALLVLAGWITRERA
jgi:ubiquinol-cytochrome c reductase cytochrome c subunit